MSIEDDNDDDEVEYIDVNFNSAAILTFEQSLANEVVQRIKSQKWSHNYFDSKGERKFTIMLALGDKLEFRISIGITMNIIIRGTSVLPGGQVPLNHPELIPTIINILRKFNKSLLSSALIPQRDLLRWRADHRKWKTDSFTYDIPEHFLFQIPKNESECLVYENTTRIVMQDRITKAVVEVIGINEDSSLIDQRARAKLFIFRELREI